jgi:hypothetical protein
MACVLPCVCTVILNRKVTSSCCSRATSAEKWPLYRRGYLHKLRMQCIFLFLWVPPAIVDRDKKLFVTWVSTVTPKIQKLLWCRCGIWSVSAFKVIMDCHIFFELLTPQTKKGMFGCSGLNKWCRKKGFFLLSSVSPLTTRQKVGYVVLCYFPIIFTGYSSGEGTCLYFPVFSAVTANIFCCILLYLHTQYLPA